MKKLTKRDKYELAQDMKKKIQEDLERFGYSSQNLMLDAKGNYYYICDDMGVRVYESDGDIFIKNIEWFDTDKKVTISKLLKLF